MDDWATKRRAELEAAAPVRKKKRRLCESAVVVDRASDAGGEVAASVCSHLVAASVVESEVHDLHLTQRQTSHAGCRSTSEAPSVGHSGEGRPDHGGAARQKAAKDHLGGAVTWAIQGL